MRPLRPALLAAALVTGCTVGPDYRRPVTPASADKPFRETAAAPAVTPAAGPEGAWWRLYRDPVLDALIADAFAANTDLRQAIGNLVAARGALREARGARLPAPQATGQYQRARQAVLFPGLGGGAGGGGAPGGFAPLGQDLSIFNVGATVSYELDLWGRVRRLIEASRADLAAQRAALDTVRVAVAADTARAYTQACAAAEQRAVALRTVQLLDRSLGLTTTTFEAGRGTRLDVERARALLEQQRATVPQFEAQRAASLYALARLTGRAPADLPAAAEACAATPRLSAPVPVGDGARLLARRPDIRQAERRLAADTARIGIQVAELYPRISLGANFGFTSLNTRDLFTVDGFNYSVGPLFSFTFPNQEAARGRILQAKGTAAASLAAFDGTVLTALAETETAISALGRELDRQTALARARDAAAQSARLSRLRFSQGYDSQLAVIDAERTLADSEAALAQSRRAVAENEVELFRALGGGWEGLPEPALARPAFDGSAAGRAQAAAPGGR